MDEVNITVLCVICTLMLCIGILLISKHNTNTNIDYEYKHHEKCTMNHSSDIVKRDNFESGKKQILNLVLFSHSEHYDKMYKITREFYKTQGIPTIYYIFNPDLKTDFELLDDILHIRGKETYTPGILDKTVKAIEYVHKTYSFDYLIRSNISTLINFKLLLPNLSGVEYGAGCTFTTSRVIHGVNQQILFGSGTSIILSKDAVRKLVLFKHLIDYVAVIDDVAIGLFFQMYYPSIKLTNFLSRFQLVQCDNPTIDTTKIFFRCKCSETDLLNRDKDIQNMQLVTKMLR